MGRKRRKVMTGGKMVSSQGLAHSLCLQLFSAGRMKRDHVRICARHCSLLLARWTQYVGSCLLIIVRGEETRCLGPSYPLFVDLKLGGIRVVGEFPDGFFP
eukprot:1151350-Pelagomonas_calceolata.AAC.2